MKPANLQEDRVDRRLAKNQSGKRKVRRRDPRARRRDACRACSSRKATRCHGSSSRVVKGTVLHADEASVMERSARALRDEAHQSPAGLQLDGACTNWAESYFSRLRRGEIGHHHHIAGPYLLRFAQEAAWREDNRRVRTASRWSGSPSWRSGVSKSVDFCGYWQRHVNVYDLFLV